MTKEAIAEHPDSVMAKLGEKNGKVTARTSFDAMKDGDEYAKVVVDKYIKYLAAGITNTINIFQPDVLCIGGGVCNEGDALLLPMKAIVEKEVYTRDSEKNTKIVIAELGNDAGIIGAAFLGRANG
jgi:glucokinase